MITTTPDPDAPGAGGAARPPTAEAEVERLRALLDRHPTCLLRIGMDGRILAANDAALAQLAARSLGEALDHQFADRLRTDRRASWQEFAGRVRTHGAASFRGVMTDLGGVEHDVQIQGVHQADHPDGADSMIVSVRDVSALAVLEGALEAQDDLRRELERAQAAIAEAAAERQCLLALAAEREAEVAELSRALEVERKRQETRRADASAQIVLLLDETSRSLALARKLVEAAGGDGEAV